MNHKCSAALCVAIIGLLGGALAQSAEKEQKPSAAAEQSSPEKNSPEKSSPEQSSPKQPATELDWLTPTAQPKQKQDASSSEPTGVADPLTASVLSDTELADARGGSETHLNQNNATGTVAGNVASQLTTGANTISESAFSNSSGIPVVIQNSGNNVLIQNSTILNLQLSNPAK
jgi:hypothetical protein